jgi:hypothetical protein
VSKYVLFWMASAAAAAAVVVVVEGGLENWAGTSSYCREVGSLTDGVAWQGVLVRRSKIRATTSEVAEGLAAPVSALQVFLVALMVACVRQCSGSMVTDEVSWATFLSMTRQYLRNLSAQHSRTGPMLCDRGHIHELRRKV